jgi:hypothetical protein
LPNLLLWQAQASEGEKEAQNLRPTADSNAYRAPDSCLSNAAFYGEFIRLHAHKLFSLLFLSLFVLSDSESEFNKPKGIVH